MTTTMTNDDDKWYRQSQHNTARNHRYKNAVTTWYIESDCFSVKSITQLDLLLIGSRPLKKNIATSRAAMACECFTAHSVTHNWVSRFWASDNTRVGLNRGELITHSQRKCRCLLWTHRHTATVEPGSYGFLSLLRIETCSGKRPYHFGRTCRVRCLWDYMYALYTIACLVLSKVWCCAHFQTLW